MTNLPSIIFFEQNTTTPLSVPGDIRIPSKGHLTVGFVFKFDLFSQGLGLGDVDPTKARNLEHDFNPTALGYVKHLRMG